MNKRLGKNLPPPPPRITKHFLFYQKQNIENLLFSLYSSSIHRRTLCLREALTMICFAPMRDEWSTNEQDRVPVKLLMGIEIWISHNFCVPRNILLVFLKLKDSCELLLHTNRWTWSEQKTLTDEFLLLIFPLQSKCPDYSSERTSPESPTKIKCNLTMPIWK